MAVSSTAEDADEDVLFAAERELVARAVPARRHEFATGRACARAALAELGVEAVPIASGPDGDPIWPEGIAGTITHCRGYRAAAVAHRSEIVTLGIDAEPDEPLSPGLIDAIALPRERELLSGLALTGQGPHWDRLLFCMKEAVYKAWYPLARHRGLGFEDALISVDRERRAFHARLLVPGPTAEGKQISGFDGRWLANGGVLMAAIALPA